MTAASLSCTCRRLHAWPIHVIQMLWGCRFSDDRAAFQTCNAPICHCFALFARQAKYVVRRKSEKPASDANGNATDALDVTETSERLPACRKGAEGPDGRWGGFSPSVVPSCPTRTADRHIDQSRPQSQAAVVRDVNGLRVHCPLGG